MAEIGEEERLIVTELTSEAEANVEEGNLYFVISIRWYTSWQRYVGLPTEKPSPSEVNRPGPIDNHDIIQSGSDASDPQLRRMLKEGVDYVLVPQAVWRKLVEWYNGGPPIPRKLICHSKSYSVEVYPLFLKLTDSTDKSNTIVRLSRQASITQLYERVCAERGLSKKEVRISHYFQKREWVLLDPSSEKSLEESCLQIDQDCDSIEMTISASESRVHPLPAPNCGTLLALPGEMITEILARVPNQHNALLSSVCKIFMKIVRSDEIVRIRRKLKKDRVLIMFANMDDLMRNWFVLRRNESYDRHIFGSVEFPRLRVPIRSVITFGWRIFLVCGSQLNPTSLLEYDPNSKEVRSFPRTPVLVTYKSSALVGNKIFVIGTERENRRELRSQCFNLSSKLWEAAPISEPLEEWRSALDIAIDRSIYVISSWNPIVYNTSNGHCEKFPMVEGDFWSRTSVTRFGNFLFVYHSRDGLVWFDRLHHRWTRVSGLRLIDVSSVALTEYNESLALLWTANTQGKTKKLKLTVINLEKTASGFRGVADPSLTLGEIPQGYKFVFVVNISGM